MRSGCAWDYQTASLRQPPFDLTSLLISRCSVLCRGLLLSRAQTRVVSGIVPGHHQVLHILVLYCDGESEDVSSQEYRSWDVIGSASGRRLTCSKQGLWHRGGKRTIMHSSCFRASCVCPVAGSCVFLRILGEWLRGTKADRRQHVKHLNIPLPERPFRDLCCHHWLAAVVPRPRGLRDRFDLRFLPLPPGLHARCRC